MAKIVSLFSCLSTVEMASAMLHKIVFPNCPDTFMVVNHLTTFYSETPEQRYVRFANKHGDLLQRIPQYYIASYVGVIPQALCRIKKKLLGRNL